MQLLAAVHNFLERISRYAVWVAGAAMLGAAIMVTVDVLMRKFFSISMSGSDEISGYIFAAATTWAYSYCVLHRSNVRIDALYNFMPLSMRAVLDIVGLVLLFIYMAYLTDKAVDVFVTSWQRNSTAITTLATPQWIPQLAWLAGLILLNITLVFLIFYTTIALVRGDTALVQQVAGTLSVQEEIAEETHGMDAMRSKS